MEQDKKISVVIADDFAETRETIRKLLQFENDIEVIGTASSGNEIIHVAHEVKPDVILMDINMPGVDGITATEKIRKNDPFVQIVILSVQSDTNYMRKAMLAGARDYLSKPPAVDELLDAVRRAGEMAHIERHKISAPVIASNATSVPGNLASVSPGKIVCVYSSKGGVGTTMTAVNLAIGLKKEDNSVVLVDGNLQFGDVAVFLNEQVRNTIADLAPRSGELDQDILEEVLVTHESSEIKILAAPPSVEYSESISSQQFVEVISFLKRFFSYVVVDTSSFLSDVVLSTMDISDIILLMTTQDIPALKNARMFLDIARTLGINSKRILLVLNRYDKRIGISPQKISENFKKEIITVIPDEERTVIPSINRGAPFVISERSRPISRVFFSLVEKVRKQIDVIEKEIKEKEMEIV